MILKTQSYYLQYNKPELGLPLVHSIFKQCSIWMVKYMQWMNGPWMNGPLIHLPVIWGIVFSTYIVHFNITVMQ